MAKTKVMKTTEVVPSNETTATKSPAKKTAWARLGAMLQAKSGNYYLKFDEDVTIKAGETVLLKKPQDEIASLVSRGVIDQEAADARLEKLPSFVKFNMVKPPNDDTAL